MVVIKLRWKKWDNSKEMASCWYCGRPNNYVLYGIDKDYFEVFCCSLCKKKLDEDDVRIDYQRPDQADAALHAAGELQRKAVLEGIEPHHFQIVLDKRAPFRLRHLGRLKDHL